MKLKIEQECPQCGASIELDETDRLLHCPYCEVRHVLFAPDHFRFVLPQKAPRKEVFYAPYLRFKGNVYFCTEDQIGHRAVDVTRVGISVKGLPETLGVRPQAMKMRFLGPGESGSLLRFDLRASDIVVRAARLASGSVRARITHRAFIGETVSLIYLPLYVDGERIFDGVLSRAVAKIPDEDGFPRGLMRKAPNWSLKLTASLCPHCGWNLDGEKDSVVLLCRNCVSAWEVFKGRFRRVDLMTLPDRFGEASYLPFWRISARVRGIEIRSFADFVRATNQPVVPRGEWENQDMRFWIPAFKVRPKIFLDLARRLTCSPDEEAKPADSLPREGVFPVTLPGAEAVQSMKVSLAGAAMNKREILPALPEVQFEVQGLRLVYMPFVPHGHDLVEPERGLSVNQQVLALGRRL